MSSEVRQRNNQGNTGQTNNEPNKPDNSAFKQQRLPAWQPVLTAKSVLPIFVVVGLVFIPIGGLIIAASKSVLEYETGYTDCQARTYWFANLINNGQRPPMNVLQANRALLGEGETCVSVYEKWAKCVDNSDDCDENFNQPDPPTCICSTSINVEKAMDSKTFAYYRLTDYYQNHRRYVKSRDDVQLLAATKEQLANPASDCSPYDTNGSAPIAPCGAIANSLFNDTFFMYDCDNDDCEVDDATLFARVITPAGTDDVPIPMTGEDIAWQTDKKQKFDPDGHTADADFFTYNEQVTLKPHNWRTNVWTLGTDDDALYYRKESGSSGLGFKNEDFIVWMRTAAFPTFRKLYRKVQRRTNTNTYVSQGQKSLLIYYNYPVKSFRGEKYFVIATTSWIGGKNFFLGYTYVVTGSLCLLVMAVLFLISRRNQH